MKNRLLIIAAALWALIPAFGQSTVFEYSDGLTVKFNPNGTRAGLNIGSNAGDPSSLNNGDAWYNSSSNVFKVRANGQTLNLGDASNLNASNLTSGTIPDARFPATLPAAVTSSSLATLGTVSAGTWNASVIAGQYGGTGVANSGKTLTLGGSYTINGTSGSTLNIATGGTLAAGAFLDASTGGNGGADSGKLAKYDGDGSIAAAILAGNSVTATTQVYAPNFIVTGGISYGTIKVDPGAALTADRTLYIPDASGTIALAERTSKAIQVRQYGAIPDDGIDDTEAIQDALDAAEAAAGGGRVELEPGVYNLITINSPASGDKAAGAYCLEIGSNTTLSGVGPATILSVTNGGEFGVGVAISPKGMRTATANYGAASRVRITDLTLRASTQHESCGNGFNLVHAYDWTIERVSIGSFYYHPIEIDQSKFVWVKQCRFYGANTGISGSRIQLDYGAAGPVNRPAGITTRSVEDLEVSDCIFEQRTAGESGSARDIELTHNNTEMVLNRVTFRGCHFTGRNEQFVSIVDIASANPPTVTGASIEASTDLVTAAGHGFWNGARVNLSAITGGAGLVVTQDYYWIYVSSTTGKLASSSANALAGTPVDVTTNANGVTMVPYVGGSISELLFERCTFVTTHPKSYAFFMAQSSGREFRGVRFRNCEFSGPSAQFICMGGSVTATYSATHTLRREGEISDCRFYMDKTQMPTGIDLNTVVAVAWHSFKFEGNYLEYIGDFAVSVGTNYSRLVVITNSWWTEVLRNRIVWKGNATFAVSRLGFLCSTATIDTAGTTQGLFFEGNLFHSDAGTGWSYGHFVECGTPPAWAAVRIAGNFCNAANSIQNGTVVTGTNVAMQYNSGAQNENVRTVTGNTTATAGDSTILANSASGNITVTLPNVLQRKTLYVVKTSALNSVVVGGVNLSALNSAAKVVTDGTTAVAIQIQ